MKYTTIPKQKGPLFHFFRLCRTFSKIFDVSKGSTFKVSEIAEKNWKGGPFGIFQHFCRKTSKKLNWGPFGEKKFPKKSPTRPIKLEGWTLWDF